MERFILEKEVSNSEATDMKQKRRGVVSVSVRGKIKR